MQGADLFDDTWHYQSGRTKSAFKVPMLCKQIAYEAFYFLGTV